MCVIQSSLIFTLGCWVQYLSDSVCRADSGSSRWSVRCRSARARRADRCPAPGLSRRPSAQKSLRRESRVKDQVIGGILRHINQAYKDRNSHTHTRVIWPYTPHVCHAYFYTQFMHAINRSAWFPCIFRHYQMDKTEKHVWERGWIWKSVKMSFVELTKYNTVTVVVF